MLELFHALLFIHVYMRSVRYHAKRGAAVANAGAHNLFIISDKFIIFYEVVIATTLATTRANQLKLI